MWIVAKRDLAPQDQLELFLAHEKRLQRVIVKLGGGPWAVKLAPSGIRTIRLPE